MTIDMLDDASIHNAVEVITRNHGHIDLLVNNAGIMLPLNIDDTPSTKRTAFAECFATNVTGAALVTDDFIPLLSTSSVPRIVFVGSARLNHPSLGFSICLEFRGIYPDQASKTALYMLAMQYARRYEDEGGKLMLCVLGM